MKRPGYDAHMVFARGIGQSLRILLVVCVTVGAITARPEGLPAPQAAPLSIEQIVEQMILRDRERARDLRHYESQRRYEVAYTGFPESLSASLVVDSQFDAASGKSFRIVSQSGSKFLIEKVLKRAIDSEKEASQTKGSTALTPANYRFNLVGNEMLASGPAYVLLVDPVQPSKFLYRGRIWVDATDFAVVKMEAQPSKNPSFWISKVLIQTTNIKAGGFWFPEKLRSESRIRLGGKAVLTIDYGNYQVEVNPPPAPGGR